MIHIIPRSCYERIDINKLDDTEPLKSITGFSNERVAYQLIVYSDSPNGEAVRYSVVSEIETKLYCINSVSVNWPCYSNDEKCDYELHDPGFLPDAMIPIASEGEIILNTIPTIIWVSCELNNAESFEHVVQFMDKSQNVYSAPIEFRILPNTLLEHPMEYTTYIDPRSIAASYNVPVFSDVFWKLLDKYMAMASENGVNSLLVPLYSVHYEGAIKFEPFQLFVATVQGRDYKFNFDLLDCWLLYMKKNNIRNIVFPPIFPTFKTLHCAQIMVQEEQKTKILFGENTASIEDKYFSFMNKLIRQTMKHLRELDFRGKITVHFSSNPRYDDTEYYKKCWSSTFDSFRKYRVFDVMPDWEMHRSGYASSPIFKMSEQAFFSMDKTISKQVITDLNTPNDPINHLIATPLARISAFSVFSYYHDFSGWFDLGFNYSYSKLKEPVDLLVSTDNGGSYPSGTCFLVYPTTNGPVMSLRLFHIGLAMQDYRLLMTVERYVSHEKIFEMIEKEFKVTDYSIVVSPKKYIAFKDKLYAFAERYNNRKNKKQNPS